MPMTKEEFDAFILTEEGKAMFGETTAKLGLASKAELERQFKEETEGLVKKKDELLGKLTKKEEAAAKYAEISQVLETNGIESTELETLLYKIKHPEANEEIVELQRSKTKAERDLALKMSEIDSFQRTVEEKENAIKNSENFIRELLINSALTSALSEHGFQHIEYILPAIIQKSKAVVEPTEDGKYRAVADDGSTLKEWVVRFKETEEGKSLRGVPTTVGGGSPGSKGTGMNKSWGEMNIQERTNLYKQNPSLYERLKEKG